LTTESKRNSRSRSRISDIGSASENTSCTSISNLVLNDKLLSFIDLLIDLDAQFRNHSLQYAFQTPPLSKSLYEGIGTLTSLLGLDTDEQTTEVLKAVKLCYTHGKQLMLHHALWREVEIRVGNGFKYVERYGMDHHNLFILGGRDHFLPSQISDTLRAPSIRVGALSNSLWLSNCLSNFNQAIIEKGNQNTIIEQDKQPMTTLPPPANLPGNSEEFDKALEEAYRKGAEDAATRMQQQQLINLPFDFDQPVDMKKGRWRWTKAGKHDVPMVNGYRAVHKNTINVGSASHQTVKTIHKKGKLEQNKLSPENSLLLGAVAAKFPQGGDVMQEQLFAIGATIISSEVGICDPTKNREQYTRPMDFDSIAALMPSRSTIKNHVRTLAAHTIILNGGRMLMARAIYIGTDHGGGVLVKMAFFWDPVEKRVIKLNLDFDTAGHTAEEGGQAVKHSIRKYILDDAQSVSPSKSLCA